MKRTDLTLTLKQEQGVQSRQQILEAALDVMARRGYAGASISVISKQSGLPVSSIYWHFESKEGLLVAVLEHGARSFVDGLPKFENLSGSRDERLGIFIRDLARRLAASPRFLRLLILMGLEQSHSDSRILETIRNVRREVIERSTHSIAEHILSDRAGQQAFARRLAALMLVTVDGAYVAHEIDPSFDLQDFFELHLKAVISLLPSVQK